MTWFALSGCWPDIRGKDYQPYDSAEQAQLPKVTNVPEGNGVTLTTVDSTDSSRWVYVDLDQDMLELDGAAAGWDLGFSRQRIKLDGGISGSEGVQLAIVDAKTLEDVTSPPTTGFFTDLADDEDDNSEPEYAFDAWFDYDSDTHVLTPKDLVFVVASSDQRLVAIEILSYYDDAGTSAIFSLRWKAFPAR